MKWSSNSKQFPSSKMASSSTKIWKPTLSTASLTESGHSSGGGEGGGGVSLAHSGTLGKIDRQQMGPLYHAKRFQDTIQVNSSLIVSSNKIEPIFLTFTSRKDWYPSPETGNGKGTKSGNSRLLLPAIPCTKKEWKVMSSYWSFFTEPIHKETTSQVCKTSRLWTMTGLSPSGLWKFWNLNQSSRWRWRQQWAHFQKKKMYLSPVTKTNDNWQSYNSF